MKDRSFGIDVTFTQPGMAERAMYFGSTAEYGLVDENFVRARLRECVDRGRARIVLDQRRRLLGGGDERHGHAATRDVPESAFRSRAGSAGSPSRT
jgi:hypothetical protein